MQNITNGILDVTVNENGSLLDSVKYRGEEYLWQGSEKSWKSKDIVIFPFVARLKDGWYTVDGKRYEMKNHGLARYNVFTAESNTGDTLVMDFKSSEETKKQYPFDFDFKVKYALVGNSMKITYTVVNTGDVDMPFGLGTHFGWALVGDETDDTCDVSGNFAIIDTDKPIEEYEFDDDLHLVKGEKKSEFTNKIPLVKSTFIHDAVVTKKTTRKKVTLLRRDGKKNHVRHRQRSRACDMVQQQNGQIRLHRSVVGDFPTPSIATEN
ncbi:MAG: hypothetical protein L6V82_05705 [Clostridiales bacterium]|nr:MAG: hypothetical protein L6V82_05705 [Clostridiales bacterium]